MPAGVEKALAQAMQPVPALAQALQMSPGIEKALAQAFSAPPMGGTLGSSRGFDATAYASPIQRAVGRTNARAFEQATRAFPDVPAPFVIPVPHVDPIREVFGAFGIELAETDTAARQAFMHGYQVALRYRTSDRGGLMTWAIGVVASLVTVYGAAAESTALSVVSAAIGVLVALTTPPKG